MAQLGNTVVNGNLRVVGNVYGIDCLNGFESTTTGTTLTFPGVPKNCLGRFRMMKNGNFTDHYFTVSSSGTVPYIVPVTGSAYVSNIQYNNTSGAVIVTIPSSMSGGFYRLEVVSQLTG